MTGVEKKLKKERFIVEKGKKTGEGNKIKLKGKMHMKRGWKACKEARTELERMLGNAKCANVY